MFKSARWRSEKNKVKVVFKLQFHAAQLVEVGADALMISVIPADTGKPSVKSDKATVRDGSCFWEKPLYETVKFNRDPKSGKIQERIYNFVVGTGSSKASTIGEASIDFSSYAEATKVSLASLTLKNSKIEAVLNVSIQRIPESNDRREVEELLNAQVTSTDHSLRAQFGSIKDGTIESNTGIVEDVPLNKTLSNETGLNGNRQASIASDITISSSESSLGVETPWEPQMKNESVQQESSGLLASLKPQPQSDVPTSLHEENHRSQWEWLGNSAHEASTDDSSSTPRETFMRHHSGEASDIVIEKLKSEIAALSRQADLSDLELQTLRKQIMKESKRSQDLSKEVIFLKEERDALKAECEKREAFQKRRMDEAKTKSILHFDSGDPWVIVEELRQELNHAKEFNANLQIQLQKTQESNSELILAVRDLDVMLEQKNIEILNISSGPLKKIGDEKSQEEGFMRQPDDESDDEEQNALEKLVKDHGNTKNAYLLEQQIMDLRGEIEIYKRDKDELEMQIEQLALDYEIMKQENHDLSYKLDQSQIQEQLKIQYECSSYSEHELEDHLENLENELQRRSKECGDSLVKINELGNQREYLENKLERRSKECGDSLVKINILENQIENLENELERRTKECGDSLVKINQLENQIEYMENELEGRSKESAGSLVTISELEAHIKSLEEELERQAQEFEADVEALTHSKVEQEQRAIRAEETLRKTRWQNANTAERLQEEFRRLSAQMTSTFEANENVAAKALAEANELRFQKSHLEEMLRKASEECQLVKDHYESRLLQLASQVTSMTNQIEQLDYQKNHAEETQRLLTAEISTLKDEIKTYAAKNIILSEEQGNENTSIHKLSEMRLSIKEMELLIEQGNDERIELESRVVVLKNEAEESRKELDKMKCLVEEKESIVGNLQSELESLQSQYTEAKSSLLEDELVKEKLKKQVLQLKSDLKKKEDALSTMDKKVKDGGGRGAAHDVTKATSKGKPLPRASKEVANLKEKIKLLEGQIKLKEAALETSTSTFLDKEKDLHYKIEELEARLEMLNQSSAQYCENEVRKAASVVEDNAPNCGFSEDTRNNTEIFCTSATKSCGNGLSEAEKASTHSNWNLEDLRNEMTLLKERNNSMEEELKEMQERYSEISLKFAEVEGERQQLVMKVRNLQNAKKSS